MHQLALYCLIQLLAPLPDALSAADVDGGPRGRRTEASPIAANFRAEAPGALVASPSAPRAPRTRTAPTTAPRVGRPAATTPQGAAAPQDPPTTRPATAGAGTATRRTRSELAASRPTPAPADVATPSALETALYDVISGPQAHPRDWNRFRSLFLPGARLLVVTANGVIALTPDDYARRAGPALEARGFYERSVHRREETFGGVAHVFSTYESRYRLDEPTPFARGVNSIQMVRDGAGWAISSLTWDEETPERPLPESLLPPR